MSEFSCECPKRFVKNLNRMLTNWGRTMNTSLVATVIKDSGSSEPRIPVPNWISKPRFHKIKINTNAKLGQLDLRASRVLWLKLARPSTSGDVALRKNRWPKDVGAHQADHPFTNTA